jgi:hypothetical protein
MSTAHGNELALIVSRRAKRRLNVEGCRVQVWVAEAVDWAETFAAVSTQASGLGAATVELRGVAEDKM